LKVLVLVVVNTPKQFKTTGSQLFINLGCDVAPSHYNDFMFGLTNLESEQGIPSRPSARLTCASCSSNSESESNVHSMVYLRLLFFMTVRKLTLWLTDAN
jgi:hypothetical protein